MSMDETDVIARLRAGADSLGGHPVDEHAVLAGSKRALRRRRTWQALGAGTTAAVVTFALALAGSVALPGVGEVTLPGGEQVRELVGLDTEPATCAAEDVTVEWGEVSSRTEPVAFVYDRKGGPAVTSEQRPPRGGISGPPLVPEVAQALTTRAEEAQQFPVVKEIDDGIGRFDWRLADIPDGWGVWWTTSELRSLPGVVRCGSLPVTFWGETSAEFTITSWSGKDESGFVSCVNPPAKPTQVEREVLDYCDFDPELED
jgi:hypothetical protein